MAQSFSPSTELIIQQANKPGEWDPTFAELNPMNEYSSPFMREIMLEAKKQNWGKKSLPQGSTIAYPVKETGLNPRYPLSFLRERCDETRVDWAACMTKFENERAAKLALNVYHQTQFENERVRNAAKLALNVYNQKEQKNFNLEKVVKLNKPGPYFCMTFRAKNAEIDECCLFRGVVNGLCNTVLLCEIKEPDHIAIPSDLDENYVEALSESKEDHSPYTD